MEQDLDLTQATLAEAIATLSEGNPGALTVLIDLAKAGGHDVLFYMLVCGPTGSDIWVEYKDNCGQDIDKFITVMRERVKDAEDLLATVKAAAS